MVTPLFRSQPTLLSPRRNQSSSTAIERKCTFFVVTRGKRSDRSYRNRSPKRLTVPVPVRSCLGVPCSRMRRRRSSYWVSMGAVSSGSEDAPCTARAYGWAPTRGRARPHLPHGPTDRRHPGLRPDVRSGRTRRPGEVARQVAWTGDGDGVELQPAGHEAQFVGEGGRNEGPVDALLAVHRLHPEHARLPVGLKVRAGNQLVVEQEGQHVVAVHALGRGRVDLQPVAETEDPLDPR